MDEKDKVLIEKLNDNIETLTISINELKVQMLLNRMNDVPDNSTKVNIENLK